MHQIITRLKNVSYMRGVRTVHSAMSTNLRQRAVVSSFICTSPRSPTGLTFALFKRSQDVRTYPGKWAVCSGSIDASDTSPEIAAQREISEETGLLVPHDIKLLRRGKPFSLIDRDLKTEWTIHPFAWELKPHAKPIKLDWEHTEVQFVAPAELPKHDHVPLLEVGMNRVLVNDETEDGIEVLRSDHESGAQALAVKALEILLDSVQKGYVSKMTGTEDFWRELRIMAWHLGKNGRPSMAAAIESKLFKALNAVRTKIKDFADEAKAELPLQAVKETAEEAIKAEIAASKNILDRLSESFVTFVKTRLPVEGESDKIAPTRIVTLSCSGTIMQCLIRMISTVPATRGISLTVLESRPNFEGVSFVNNLLASLQTRSINTDNLDIFIVSDASAAIATKTADYLVLGSDKVLHNGDVCNKMGSLPTAITAKAVNPNCHVIATFDNSKVTTSSFEEDHAKAEYNEEAEMVAAWPKEAYEKLQRHRDGKSKIEVQNAYFEWIAAKWIDTYISEDGVLSVSDIERLSRQTTELEDVLFTDL